VIGMPLKKQGLLSAKNSKSSPRKGLRSPYLSPPCTQGVFGLDGDSDVFRPGGLVSRDERPSILCSRSQTLKEASPINRAAVAPHLQRPILSDARLVRQFAKSTHFQTVSNSETGAWFVVFECRRGLEGHSATGLALDARSTPTTAISGITQDGFFKETTGIYSPVSSRPHHLPVLFLSLGVVKWYR
jgi:hypothetical protein